MNCFYCNETVKKSNEHIISKGVLKYVFGENIENYTKGTIWGSKTLFDHEQTIKDVCRKCNSLLNTIDNSGIGLIKEIDKYYDLTGIIINYNLSKHLWVLKTHLNFIRMYEKNDKQEFTIINKAISDSLIKKQLPPTNLYFFLVNGYKGDRYYWEKENQNHIQYFSYHVRPFIQERIVCSHLTCKAFCTFLLIPSNNNYDNFVLRSLNVIKEMKDKFNFDLQLIIIENILKDGYLIINKTEKISKYIIPWNCFKS